MWVTSVQNSLNLHGIWITCGFTAETRFISEFRLIALQISPSVCGGGKVVHALASPVTYGLCKAASCTRAFFVRPASR